MEKPKLKTTRWDSAGFLKTEEDIAEYLNAAKEENDPALLAHASEVAEQARRRPTAASNSVRGES